MAEFNKFEQLIPVMRTTFVTADLDEGKTCFCYYLLSKIPGPVFVYKHPRPELIEKLKYHNMRTIDDLERMNNITLWIDEPQIVFPKYEKRGSAVLNNILSLARQKDIRLILSTSDTRYITAAEEFYISTYIIKRIDYAAIKRGSKVKEIINSQKRLTAEGYCKGIEIDEYLLYTKKREDLTGKYSFRKPDFFDENYSKPFS